MTFNSFELHGVNLPEMKKGKWSVEHFNVDREDWRSALRGRSVPLGKTFTRLMRGNTLVMSDTPAEKRDHESAYYRAKGHCLVNGLGIGMIIKNLLAKDGVTKVTVVEISQDLIDLIAPHYQDPRLTIVCANALDYQPPKGERYGMVWHDIWDSICADNLEDMRKLHHKYGRCCDWQGSWARELCESANRRW